MSKVISTDVMGDQLTSRHFARNLVPGDLFVSGTGRVIEVLGSQSSEIDVLLLIQGKAPSSAGAYQVPYDINQSVDYIIGSRSGGHVGCN